MLNQTKGWSLEIIKQVWIKAKPAGIANEAKGFRRDVCGAWIQLNQYGNRDSVYGWEIDHIVPSSLGGSDALTNLQPLHWRNNAEKGDSVVLKCAIGS